MLQKNRIYRWGTVILNPFLVPFFVLSSWIFSVRNSLKLLFGRWKFYLGFHPANAINSLFYRTQWNTINEFGRNGISPYIGLGKFTISNWWHLSAIASLIYTNAGAVTTLGGTVVLIFSFFIWSQVVNIYWVSAIVVILFFSSTSIMTAFHRQNYQILSWLWLPIALFGLLNQQYLLASIFITISALFGLTSLFVIIPIVFVIGIVSNNMFLIFLLLPAILLKSLNFIPIVFNSNIKSSVSFLGKMIGFQKGDVVYVRKSMKFSLHQAYFFITYGQLLVVFWIVTNQLSVLLLLGFLIFSINQLYIRFVDDQSITLFYVIIACTTVIQHGFNPFLALSLLVVVNPYPKYLEIANGIKMHRYSPFDLKPVLDSMNEFLCIPENSRIIFAFNNPQGIYEKIFDGYRIMLEAPLAVAAEKKIHLFPDWWAVGETNYKEAPEIWGRSITDVKSNLDFWETQYVIVYQATETELEAHWIPEFEIISSIDWVEKFPDFRKWNLINDSLPAPKWWLLKKSNCVIK
jgi:hypothetical protein